MLPVQGGICDHGQLRYIRQFPEQKEQCRQRVKHMLATVISSEHQKGAQTLSML